MDIPIKLKKFKKPFCDAECHVVFNYFKQYFPYSTLDSQLLRYPKSTWKAIRALEAVRNPAEALDWPFYRNRGFRKIWIRQERISRMIKLLLDYKTDWDARKKKLGKKYKKRVLRMENNDLIKSYSNHRRKSNGPSFTNKVPREHVCNVLRSGTCKLGKGSVRYRKGRVKINI